MDSMRRYGTGPVVVNLRGENYVTETMSAILLDDEAQRQLNALVSRPWEVGRYVGVILSGRLAPSGGGSDQIITDDETPEDVNLEGRLSRNDAQIGIGTTAQAVLKESYYLPFQVLVTYENLSTAPGNEFLVYSATISMWDGTVLRKLVSDGKWYMQNHR